MLLAHSEEQEGPLPFGEALNVSLGRGKSDLCGPSSLPLPFGRC